MGASVLIMWCALAANPAETSWEKSFPPGVVGTYFAANSSVMVVRAGRDSETRAATSALVSGLRGSGRVELVMTDEPLGEVAAMSDKDIVEKSSVYPVNVVAVVRTFPGPRAGVGTAVISLFSTKGALITAVSADQGSPIEKSPIDNGVSEVAFAAVASTLDASSSSSRPRRGPAQAEGQQASVQVTDQYVGFLDAALVDVQTGRIVNTWSSPFQGPYRQMLSWPEFYRAVDRPDLAEQYERNRSKQLTIFLTMALGVPLGGGLVALIGLGLQSVVLAGFGGVVALASLCFSPLAFIGSLQPVEPHVARELADKHNRRLGLVAEAPSAPVVPAFSVRF